MNKESLKYLWNNQLKLDFQQMNKNQKKELVQLKYADN